MRRLVRHGVGLMFRGPACQSESSPFETHAPKRQGEEPWGGASRVDEIVRMLPKPWAGSPLRSSLHFCR